jgi:hypothetical protein
MMEYFLCLKNGLKQQRLRDQRIPSESHTPANTRWRIVARKWGSALMIDRQSLMDYLQKVEAQGGRRGPKHQG